MGYPSHPEAAATPWRRVDLQPGGADLQARLFRAFCAAAAEDAGLSGYYVWNWFGWGGSTDVGYTPRGKPAAAVLQRCMTMGINA